MRWSVSVKAEGDVDMTHDQILELADAVAIHNGIASGVNQPCYGAQIVLEADNRALAEHNARRLFVECAQQAGLPTWPITECEALSEEDDIEPNMY